MEPSSATSTLVLAVLSGCPTFSATEPATIQMRRALATSRMAASVVPSRDSAVAIRSSSRPMKAKFSGGQVSFAPRSAASLGRRMEVARLRARFAVEVIWTAPSRYAAEGGMGFPWHGLVYASFTPDEAVLHHFRGGLRSRRVAPVRREVD